MGIEKILAENNQPLMLSLMVDSDYESDIELIEVVAKAINFIRASETKRAQVHVIITTPANQNMKPIKQHVCNLLESIQGYGEEMFTVSLTKIEKTKSNYILTISN